MPFLMLQDSDCCHWVGFIPNSPQKVPEVHHWGTGQYYFVQPGSVEVPFACLLTIEGVLLNDVQKVCVGDAEESLFDFLLRVEVLQGICLQSALIRVLSKVQLMDNMRHVDHFMRITWDMEKTYDKFPH